MNITITLSKINFKHQELLLINFPYHPEVKEYVKNFQGIRWSTVLKSFYIPFSKQTTNKLFLYLRKRKYFVDYSALFEQKSNVNKVHRSKKIKIKENPRPDVIHHINVLKKWMYQKRYSINTIKTYESMLLLFFGFHNNKSIEDISIAEVEDYNTRYILANDFSHTYQNQTISALKLLYSYYDMATILPGKLERPKKQSKLPIVLSIREIQDILASISNLKHKALLCMLYSCGLRIGETLNIRVKDLNLERGFTHIKSGKGKKDRYVPIPRRMQILLIRYIEAYKPDDYLFKGVNNVKYSAISARQVLKRALVKVGIKKSVTLHTLRHSYATHLLENGTDIRYIQELLGHNSPKTTMIYTHVSSTNLDNIKNPFDDFEL
ncbi:tyrosine-type recombinase/integrase [Spongiimicrobium salis]|uniref:tyrosine-type recombinase/integrase n=1 Tax=Spongiimicrobium salis TaxID=1667022 RepID=UPI00374C89E3